jgi:predicted amidohydrolase
VSLMICASEFTPEIARLPALKGSKVLFYISYEGDVSKYVEQYQPSNPDSRMVFDVAYQVLPQARAIENHMFVIQANAAEMVENVGTMGGSHGESKIVDTLGHMIAKGPVYGETLLVATLNLAEASPPTFERMREQLPMFAKMWEAGMATVFSRMPIEMRKLSV